MLIAFSFWMIADSIFLSRRRSLRKFKASLVIIFLHPMYVFHSLGDRLRVRRPQASSIISSNPHILAVLSALAVARCFPSGLKATSLTEPSCSILSIVSQKGADRALIAISKGRLRRSKRYATTFCIGPQLKLWIQTLTALPVIRFSQKYS